MNVEGLETGGTYGSLLYRVSKTINFSDSSTTPWSLVSQLSSTHISASREGNLLTSISKLISMFCAGIGIKTEELLSQITKIIPSTIVRRFGHDAWRGFVEGVEFDIFIRDEDQSHFAFFLCSIINQYLSACVSMNSFVQLNMISEKTNQRIAYWNPTSGRKNVV
jgi:type VI secretion system protein ImpG